MRDNAAGLESDLGGRENLTTAQKRIIQSMTMKGVRLALLAENLLAGESTNEKTDHHLIAWSNSLRLDAMAARLERKSRDITPTLDAYIAAKTRDGGK